jgi:hypothetical protein
VRDFLNGGTQAIIVRLSCRNGPRRQAEKASHRRHPDPGGGHRRRLGQQVARSRGSQHPPAAAGRSRRQPLQPGSPRWRDRRHRNPSKSVDHLRPPAAGRQGSPQRIETCAHDRRASRRAAGRERRPPRGQGPMGRQPAAHQLHCGRRR